MQEDADLLLQKMEDTEDSTSNGLKLMIRIRLDMENDFQEGRKKKSFLWGKVLSKILEVKPDFEMTREQICRKFLNFQTTYKRIKHRSNSTGRSATSWEFYDMFDEVYGTKYSIKPPIHYLQSSLHITPDVPDVKQEDFSTNDPIYLSENLADDNFYHKKKRQKISDEDETLDLQSSLHIIPEVQYLKQEDLSVNDSVGSSDNLADENSFHKKKRQKIRGKNETLDFLKKEAERDEKRHKEIMDLERSKIELEKERIKVMVDLKNILQKLLEK